jgi:hypothetical protein
MHRVEHRQLTAHRTHGPVVSNVFHCKRPRSIIPSLFHLLRKSHYDYATEPFFDLLDTRTSSGPYPRDSGRRRLSDTLREKVPSSRFDLSFTGISGAMLFSSTSQFSIGPPRRRYRPQAGPASDKSAVNLVGACLLTQQCVQAPGYFNRDAGLDARDLGRPLRSRQDL